ncbi:DUF3889 domain-containing protein [Aneurinibacillus sp. Ricciae_BoGa-3]|uniref:DUF3889 domain-containing protein n=1 Tax=Aneurinibacillus sp. Ricciae_BoGa-3 TaxID=3022697 RepID=UPI002341DF72|nr:DUF3889 domain-containing protein [Aneurinibacillus sp. Ricciae_BoGa-3]WCK55988.1 DUF3889 domain-containing protein [Aneurinibacillus sp. Ricciae_BoGa-3]
MFFHTVVIVQPVYSQQHVNEPSYAKWGRFAVDAVSKKYPGKVVDYLHLGRKVISQHTH